MEIHNLKIKIISILPWSFFIVILKDDTRVDVVVVTVLISSVVGRGFASRLVYTKEYEIGIATSPIITQHYGVRTITD